MQRVKKKTVFLAIFMFMLAVCMIIFYIQNSEKTKASAVELRYVTLGKINYVANLPYNAGYSGSANYSKSGIYAEFFEVTISGSIIEGVSTAPQDEVFNFKPIKIIANVKQTKSPHNPNYPFAHMSYKLVNNDTRTTVQSGNLSGSGERTLVSRSLADGYYTLEYVAGGQLYGLGAGTIIDTYTYSFYIDSTPPSYSLTAGGVAISSGSYVNKNVTFSANDERFNCIFFKKETSSNYTSTLEKSRTISSASINNCWWYFYAVDKVGNRTPTISVYIDTVFPIGKVTSNGSTISNGWRTNSSFSYTATDRVGIDYGEYKPPNSSSWQRYTLGTTISASATNGLYYFRAKDIAGNYSAEYSVFLDTTKPSGTLYADSRVMSSGSITNASYIKFVAEDQGVGIKNIYVLKPNSSSYVSYSNSSQQYTSGTYYFFCKDNLDNISATYTITLDRTLPQLTCSGAEFGGTASNDFTVSASDSVSAVTIYYKYENEGYKPSSGSFTTDSSSRDGKYFFYARDSAGNVSSTYFIILSKQSPVGRFVSSEVDNSVYFTWDNNYWTATLNGMPYVKGSWITQEGRHVLLLIDGINRSKSYEFSVEHYLIFVETKPPTCTEQGYDAYECSQCKVLQKSNYIEAAGHDYEESIQIATCTEMGKTAHACLACAHEYYTDEVYASGHSYYSEIIQAANCDTKGERYYECDKCSHNYNSEIPPLGHNYKVTSVADGDSNAHRQYDCAVCGHSYIQEINSQHEKVTSYVESLFNKYSPYMIWVFLATSGVWSIFIGINIILAKKNDDKEKAKKMLINYGIGMVVIFVILVACPYLIRGIASLVS